MDVLKSTTDDEAEAQVTSKLKDYGWSVIPRCSWLVLDDEGRPCCKYWALREHLTRLRIAQFTCFDQRYVAEAIAHWRENYPQDNLHACSPQTCPSRLARYMNELHRKAG